MLRKDLIKAVAADTGSPQKLVSQVIDGIERAVLGAVRSGQEVMLLGLGKLVTSRRGEKRARDMVTGEPVVVPPRNAVLLRPSESLVAAANGK